MRLHLCPESSYQVTHRHKKHTSHHSATHTHTHMHMHMHSYLDAEPPGARTWLIERSSLIGWSSEMGSAWKSIATGHREMVMCVFVCVCVCVCMCVCVCVCVCSEETDLLDFGHWQWDRSDLSVCVSVTPDWFKLVFISNSVRQRSLGVSLYPVRVYCKQIAVPTVETFLRTACKDAWKKSLTILSRLIALTPASVHGRSRSQWLIQPPRPRPNGIGSVFQSNLWMNFSN